MTNELLHLTSELQRLRHTTEVLQHLVTGAIRWPPMVVHVPLQDFPEDLDALDGAVAASQPVELDVAAVLEGLSPDDQQRYRQQALAPIANNVDAKTKVIAQQLLRLSCQVLGLPLPTQDRGPSFHDRLHQLHVQG